MPYYKDFGQQQAYQSPIEPWTTGNSREQVERGGAFLRGRGQSSRENKFQSRGRKNYQSSRVERHRETVGAINSENYDKAIRSKLLAGLKDEATGVATKEAALLETSVPLQITTRQLGFGLTKMLNTANVDTKLTQMVDAGRGTINQYYRIAMSLTETKLFKTSIRVAEAVDQIGDLPNFKHSSEFQNISTSAVLMPEPIATFINSIGIFKDTTDTMFISMPEDYIARGEFIPLPENIRISNLRRTVLALADPDTAENVRTHFENHNPIPVTIWANHLLLNPDDIIADEYEADDLEADLTAVAPHLERLFEKYPKYTGRIDWDKFESGKEVFVSNSLAEMKLTPRNRDEAESVYTTRNRVIGDHEIFKMRFPMKDAELCRGINLLMGEITHVRSRQILYAPRIVRYLRYKSTLNYKSVINMRYVT